MSVVSGIAAMPSAATVDAELEASFVLLGIPDLQGCIRGKALTQSAFDAAVLDGAAATDLLLALDPVDEAIDTYEGIGIRAGAADLVVHPDTDTVRDLAWQPGWRVCLATPSWRDGRVCELASREVLRHVLRRVEGMGFGVRAAFEYEVRVAMVGGAPVSSGISYSVAEISRLRELIEELRHALVRLGVELTAAHTEAGAGLIELNLAPAGGIEAADQATYLKLAVKELAAARGLRASFMAKPAAGEEGSSGHVHLSLWRGDANAFSEGGADQPLGPTAAAAVGGILQHLPAASLVLNPTINSYKRLVPGFFAPVNATWGIENRSAALRVIVSTDHPGRNRIECRRSGADTNPYLVLAVLLAAALDGLQRRAQPPPPVAGDATIRQDVPSLPASLEAALGAWRADPTLRSALGTEFSDYYAVSREWELRAFQRSVTEWERDRYERAV